MTRVRIADLLQRILSVTMAAGCAASVAPTDGSAPPDVRVIPEGGSCVPVTLRDNTCNVDVLLPCPPIEAQSNTTLTSTVCQGLCPRGMNGAVTAFQCSGTPASGGAITLSCVYCVQGRRTEGLTEPDLVASSLVGTVLARAATLEEGSVLAFEKLSTQLRAHGLPTELLARIAQAAQDERIHTQLVSEAARQFGAEPQSAELSALPERTLAEIAVENAVEGCVRETFGALLAGWQSTHAGNDTLRTLFGTLARDESEHAQLSWDIQDWLTPQLTPFERDVMTEAVRVAIEQLVSASDSAVSPELVHTLGMPDAMASRRLIAQLESAVWRERLTTSVVYEV